MNNKNNFDSWIIFLLSTLKYEFKKKKISKLIISLTYVVYKLFKSNALIILKKYTSYHLIKMVLYQKIDIE